MKLNKSNKQIKKELPIQPLTTLPVVTLDAQQMSVVSGGGVTMSD